ncbi:MAG: hypothetical protein SGPRY_010537, partial [Prymnesium sp.]
MEDDLQRRLRALKGYAPAPPSDEELFARLQRLKGSSAPSTSPAAPNSAPSPPACVCDEEELLLRMSASSVHGGASSLAARPLSLPQKPLSEAEQVEELLSIKSSELRLEGIHTNSPHLSAQPRGGSALSPQPRERSQPAAPSRGELKSLGREAKSVLGEVRKLVPPSLPAEDEMGEEEEAEEAAALLEQVQQEIALEAKLGGVTDPVVSPIPAPARSREVPNIRAVDFPQVPNIRAVDFPQVPSNGVSANRAIVASRAQEEDMSRWCHICTDDAAVWCSDCENEPYCRRCFKEAHIEPDMRDHAT